MALTFLIVIILVNLIKGKTSVSPHENWDTGVYVLLLILS